MTSETPGEGEGLWVRTEPGGDGYITTISYSPDRIFTLDSVQAMDYGATCFEAAQRCSYDAATFLLLTEGLRQPVEAAGYILLEMRANRVPIDHAPTYPLQFEPGVTLEGKPFLRIMVDGEQFGQLSPAQLSRHAQAVLQAPMASELDTGLFRYLTTTLTLDEPRARQVIGSLAKWLQIAEEKAEQE